jgi:hypothetical protein
MKNRVFATDHYRDIKKYRVGATAIGIIAGKESLFSSDRGFAFGTNQDIFKSPAGCSHADAFRI